MSLEIALERIAKAVERNATELDLSSLGLTSIPKEIQRVRKLEVLDLSFNKISKVENLAGLPLKTLNLINNQISKLENLGGLPLQELNLAGNQISKIENLAGLPLQGLNLWSNQISKIENLEGLFINILNLESNQISKIENLAGLPLQELDLSHNKISKIENLTGLPLEKLILSTNQISKIENLSGLPLQELDLSYNQIGKIENLTGLPLQELNLWSNKIKEIHPLLPFLEQGISVFVGIAGYFIYKGIQLINNPIEDCPIEVIAEGREAVLNYFKDIAEKGKFYVYESKMLIVGEPRAGKTTLRKNLFHPNYKVQAEDKETIGVEVCPNWQFAYTENRKQVFTANIWDFGGQEKQYPLHQYFMSENTLYVLLSDDRADNASLDKWFSMIKLLGGKDYQLIVVLNEIKRNSGVTNFKPKKYKDLGFDFEVHQLDFSKDTARMQELTAAIQKSLSNLPHIRMALPGNCENVRNKLVELRNNKRDFISYAEYETACVSVGLVEEAEQAQVLRYLGLIGDIVHYDSDDGLLNLLVLNPHWIIDAIYAVITHADFDEQHSKGRFTKQELFDFWKKPCGNRIKGYSENECRSLLPLLLKNQFDICFKIKDSERYLVPLCMPEDLPEHDFDEKGALELLFRYEVMPPGMITRLIVRLSDDIAGELVSKTGIVLEKAGVRAKVEEYKLTNDANKYIRLSVAGAVAERKPYLAMLKKELLDVQKDWFKNLQFDELVPCICAECQAQKVPDMHRIETIQKRLGKNSKTVICKNGNDVDIFALLGDVYQGFEGVRSLEDLYALLRQGKLSSDTAINIINIIGNENNVGQHLRDSGFYSNQARKQAANPAVASAHISFAAASPDDTARLRLTDELKPLEAVFKGQNAYAKAELYAATWQDLLAAVQEHKSKIFHFCGHGSDASLLFEDKNGNRKEIGIEALLQLRKACTSIEIVVLNSCHSARLCEQLAAEGVTAIGVSADLPDGVGRLFSTAFYRGILQGDAVNMAFEAGKTAVIGENSGLEGLYQLYEPGSRVP